MKRTLFAVISITFFVALLFMMPTKSYARNPLYKLGRGFVNSWTCQYEFSDHVHNDLYNYGPVGFLSGSFKGLFSMIGRAAAGAYDVVTFPIPIPWRYKAPMDPEVNI